MSELEDNFIVNGIHNMTWECHLFICWDRTEALVGSVASISSCKQNSWYLTPPLNDFHK